MRAGWLKVVVSCCCLAATAHGADLDVAVRNARGDPVVDAVVTAVAQGAAPSAPARPPVTRTIDQKNETFIPYIEVFRPGDSVVFHNSDRTRHHAYSFAPARQFEFVLAPGESSTPLRLDQVGVIAVGCNIHDHMITYFYVTDARFVARSGSDGHAHLDLPPGTYDVRVWHPQQRPGSAERTQTATIAGSAAAPAPLSFTFALLPDPRVAPDRERGSY